MNVAAQVLCADTEDEARRLALSRNLVRLNILRGRGTGVPPVDEAEAYPYSGQERAYLEQQRQVNIDGDPDQVRTKLEQLAKLYQTDDLSVVTICYEFSDRVRSYELIAQVCGLTGP